MVSQLLPSERARLGGSRMHTASRYSLPGKKPGSEIAFGIDRTFGRYFQWFPNADSDPVVDEDRLDQAEIGALLKRYGKPGRNLELSISAFMLDLDPGEHGVRGIRATVEEREARYNKGPEGRKQWEADMKADPERREVWDKNTEEYGAMLKKTADCEPYIGDLGEFGDEEFMFARGEDVPLGDLPKELQENVENPPPAVEKLREQMEGSAGEESMHQKFGPEEDMLPIEVVRMRSASRRHRLSWHREAAGGLYGFTKQTQRDVEASVRKAQKRALSIARTAFGKDERVVAFLQAHAKRGRSSTAKLLLASLKEIGPKVASEKAPSVKTSTTGKEARGLYGHPAKTARLGLSACGELRAFVGEVASDLHGRRTARYARITGFLGEHSKKARCAYSRMLLNCYPDAPKTAGCEKLPEGPMRDNCEKKKEESPKGKKKADFDAREIAEIESGGALESQPDEPYVVDNFTQQEFHELLDKQEKGDLEDLVADEGPAKMASPLDSVSGWLEWQD